MFYLVTKTFSLRPARAITMDRVKGPIYYPCSGQGTWSWTCTEFNLWYGPLSVKSEQFMETLEHKLFMKWILNQFRLFDSEGCCWLIIIPIEKDWIICQKNWETFSSFWWLFTLIAILSGWILTKTDCCCLVSVSIAHWMNFEQQAGILTIKFCVGSPHFCGFYISIVSVFSKELMDFKNTIMWLWQDIFDQEFFQTLFKIVWDEKLKSATDVDGLLNISPPGPDNIHQLNWDL